MLIVVCTPSALGSEHVRLHIEFMSQRGGAIVPIYFGVAEFDEFPSGLRDRLGILEPDDALHRGPTERATERLQQVFRHLQQSQRAEPPPKILKPTDTSTRPLNEGKLILVGRGEVGKTSIVRRLVDDNFKGDESKTQGINITPCYLSHNREYFRLNVWDFGGQEIMHATHQFFLTQQSVYVLVLNGRGGGEDLDAEYWLKHIEGFGGESPIIVVQNKIGQQPFDLNYRGLRGRYPQIRGFIKADCRDNIGLKELRELIISVVVGMPEVRMQFPSDWFTVKTRLESMAASI